MTCQVKEMGLMRTFALSRELLVRQICGQLNLAHTPCTHQIDSRGNAAIMNCYAAVHLRNTDERGIISAKHLILNMIF
jgi:hypothetical protein